MSAAPLYVDDSANITISEIRSKCRRLKQQENLGLVVIDYLQLMTSGRQVESRQQEVSAMSRNLKLLAKDLDIPVIAVAQLNRNSEGRTDRKPMMSDLRESGSLEQDADIIILLHRPDYYDKEDRPGEADIIVAKHRAGATATVTCPLPGRHGAFRQLHGTPRAWRRRRVRAVCPGPGGAGPALLDCAWPLCVPVGGGPPARSPHASLRLGVVDLEARPGPAAAHRHRGQALQALRRPPIGRRCVAVRG